jgi:hypothetical protein
MHNLREDWIPSAPHHSLDTLKQLFFLAKELDEFSHPRSFEVAFSASYKILSHSASFSELANMTCQHLSISKFDLWRNKSLWTLLKKTWESNKLCDAADHEESEEFQPMNLNPPHLPPNFKMDVMVTHKKHEVYAATMESDSQLDQDARNSGAEKDLHNLKARLTGHLLSRTSGSHPAAVMMLPRASVSTTTKTTLKPSSSFTLSIPSPSTAVTPAPPKGAIPWTACRFDANACRLGSKQRYTSQECSTQDSGTRDPTTHQHTPFSPDRTLYAANVLTTDAFRRVIQDKSSRYLSSL